MQIRLTLMFAMGKFLWIEVNWHAACMLQMDAPKKLGIDVLTYRSVKRARDMFLSGLFCYLCVLYASLRMNSTVLGILVVLWAKTFDFTPWMCTLKREIDVCSWVLFFVFNTKMAYYYFDPLHRMIHTFVTCTSYSVNLFVALPHSI